MAGVELLVILLWAASIYLVWRWGDQIKLTIDILTGNVRIISYKIKCGAIGCNNVIADKAVPEERIATFSMIDVCMEQGWVKRGKHYLCPHHAKQKGVKLRGRRAPTYIEKKTGNFED